MPDGLQIAWRRLRNWPGFALAPVLTLALAVGVNTGIFAVALPQQPTPFKASVDLVEVDVRVTDSEGRFVEDLRAEDFELFEDGIQRQVRAFYVVYPDVGEDVAVRAAGPARPIWIFFFDDRNLQADGLQRSYDAAEQFIARRLPAGALVGIVYRDTMLSNRIASDREELLRTLSGVRMPAPDSDGGSVWASRLLAERGTANSLATLDRLVDRLGYLPGPRPSSSRNSCRQQHVLRTRV